MSPKQSDTTMLRLAALILACTLALANAPANAQAVATPAPPGDRDASTAGEPHRGSAQVPTADDICGALEQSAAQNGLRVEFFARVIWQESRFGAQTVSQEGAEGIAQFMPATTNWHGLADPFGRKLTAAPTQFCFRAISDVARSERMTYR
jgi:soluble lytic murein transglycosylase-like protein